MKDQLRGGRNRKTTGGAEQERQGGRRVLIGDLQSNNPANPAPKKRDWFRFLSFFIFIYSSTTVFINLVCCSICSTTSECTSTVHTNT